MQLYQKTMSKEAWPCLHLSADEAVACHLVTNAVNVYRIDEFTAGLSCISRGLDQLLNGTSLEQSAR